MDEWPIKQKRLAEFLDRHGLDGVLLARRDNFAWVTCGKDNHVANNTPVGVASILADRDGKRVCLANAIESPRIAAQELGDSGIETVSFPWYDGDAAKKAAGEVIGGRIIAADSNSFGLPLSALPGDFDQLRWSLTEAEILRYREGASRAAAAMETACRAIRRGMDEHEIAGLLDHQIHKARLNPLVTLVAGDDRITQFRHPIPKPLAVRDRAMLVTCAAFGGLVSCLTRFVAFTPAEKELSAKYQAIANIDASVNLATRPGRTLGEIFADLQRAYADAGYADQWQFHHQGGSTGYNPRDAVATPGNSLRVAENQAFAWNPSITGAKSEDTVLVTDKGIEVLTAHSSDWPSISGRAGAGGGGGDGGGGDLRRAGVLTL
jgi:Xaa-Pro aminopeptidase